jgi:hypothetical protein
VAGNLSDANLDLLVALYQWMTSSGSKGFLEERAIPSLPQSLPSLEVRALLRTATEAGLLRRDIGFSAGNPNLPSGNFWEFTGEGIATTRSRIDETQRHMGGHATTFSSFCNLLLVALADHTDRQGQNFDSFDLRAIAELYALEFKIGWIERASEVFQNSNWATINRVLGFGQDGGVHATLTGDGLLKVEALKNQLVKSGVALPTYPSSVDTSSLKTSTSLSAGTAPHSTSGNTLGSFSSSAFAFSTNSAPTIIAEDTDSAGPIPAADRFVTRSDNAPLFEKAEQELEALTEAVRAANDLRVTADERLAIISEVEGISSLLRLPAVRARAIYDAVLENSLLKWLAVAAGAGVVGEKATAAVNALLALVGL